MALPKEGSFESLSLASYLAQLARARANGTLRFERDSLIKVLYFKEGLVSYASSNEETDRLGHVLIRAGKLTKEQLDLATSKLTGGKTLGKQLTELGFITPEELLWAAKKQVEDIAVSLFGWPSGTYEWMEGELPEGLVHLKLPTESLLLSGVFSIEDREKILSDLRGHDAVYNFTVDFMDTYEKLSVPETVDTVIAGVDGVRTVRDLAQLSRDGEFRGYQILFFAKAYGLVECIKAKTVQEEVPTAKRVGARAPSPPAGEKPAAPSASPAPAQAPSPPPAAPAPAVSNVLEKAKDAEAPVDMALEAPQEAALESPLADASLGDKGHESLFNVDPSLAKESSSAPRKLLFFLFVVFLLAAGTYGLRTYFRNNPPAWLAFWQEEATDISTVLKERIESPIPPSEQTPEAAPALPSSEEPQEGEAPAPPPETPPEPEKAAPVERREPGPKEPPPEPEPVPAPSAETGEGKLPFPRDAEARASLRRGRYTDAADVWKEDLGKIPSSRYAIQIAIFCEVSSIKRSWEESNQGPSFYIVSSPFKGRPCYRACWGVYESRSEAKRAQAAMPRYFRELKHKPQIVRVSSLR